MATATRNLASKSDEFASTARAKEREGRGGGGEEKKNHTHSKFPAKETGLFSAATSNIYYIMFLYVAVFLL